ncbi:MAG TPA: hypothetical protein VHU91_05940, partial [Mycobacteriales bacterium]|nr:hypothetical protein [Mycobacteriales bacterium]
MPSETDQAPPRETMAPSRAALRRAALAAIIVGVITAAASAVALVKGDTGVAASVLPYTLLLVGVWMVSRGNLPVVVLVAYLIGPAPADNLLPQVFIFPVTDYALRPRDMFFVADLVLLAALAILAVRGRAGSDSNADATAPDHRWLRWWCAGLALLAVYPVVIGAWFGAGQSIPAVIQGATMPLRGIAVAGLIAMWLRWRSWEATLRDLARTFVVTGVLLALAAVGALLLAHLAAPGQNQYSLLGYPLVVDRRPALPGWGNNILSNYLCVCVAILMILRRRMGWKPPVVFVTATALLLGLVFTEMRTAMLVSLLIIGATIV